MHNMTLYRICYECHNHNLRQSSLTSIATKSFTQNSKNPCLIFNPSLNGLLSACYLHSRRTFSAYGANFRKHPIWWFMVPPRPDIISSQKKILKIPQSWFCHSFVYLFKLYFCVGLKLCEVMVWREIIIIIDVNWLDIVIRTMNQAVLYSLRLFQVANDNCC